MQISSNGVSTLKRNPLEAAQGRLGRPETWLQNVVGMTELSHLLSSWFSNDVVPESVLHGAHHGRIGPPPCVKVVPSILELRTPLPHESGTVGCACTADSKAPYLAAAPPGHVPRLSTTDAKALRVFFLDGHVGPMNDMLATLHETIGVSTENVEGMVFLQGMLVRSAIDKRFFKCRLCNLGMNTSREIVSWLLQKPNQGRTFTLPECERKRCRESIHNDETRRDFARLFGQIIEAKYDVVACNFPTWQCSLFMYVNVAIIMRYTHRYDHHLQQIQLGKPHRASACLLNKGSTSMAEEATHVVRHMASMPNVVLAASNAYDWLYLRRNIGVAAVPWPGLSVQLSRVRYTGGSPSGRREVLFCCGSSPYNKPIAQWAELIVNASRRFMPLIREHHLNNRVHAPTKVPLGEGLAMVAPFDGHYRISGSIQFAWLNDLYPKSFHCKRVKVTAASATGTRGTVESTEAAASAHPKASAERRLEASAPGEELWAMSDGLRAMGASKTMETGKAAMRHANSMGRVGRDKGVLKRSKLPKSPKGQVETQCGYKYEDVASHPLAVLLPYSVHSYGLVQAYSMGIPIVAPSIELLSSLHAATGVMGHKGPGNVPWRSTKEQPIKHWLVSTPGLWFVADPTPGAPCCANEPNDACNSHAAGAWLQFADWYVWPHVQLYSTPEELVVIVDLLLRNATLRNEISAAQKAYFASEMRRTDGHVRVALHRALRATKKTPINP